MTPETQAKLDALEVGERVGVWAGTADRGGMLPATVEEVDLARGIVLVKQMGSRFYVHPERISRLNK